MTAFRIANVAIISSFALLGASRVQAGPPSLPTGGAFATGTGSISQSGTALTVTQSSNRGIINWKSFNIGAGQTVQFNNGAGATLNRVTGGTLSSILGHLNATGTIYLVNAKGVIIGPTGVVKTGGSFIASTHDITDSSFMAGGSLLFKSDSDGSVINLGRISALGGDVVLIARDVSNQGTIEAPTGIAALAGGQEVVLRDAGAPGDLIGVRLTGNGRFDNEGTIAAAQAELKAAGGNLYALAGNNGGTIRASGFETRGGRVVLTAGSGDLSSGGTIQATNPDGSGGKVTLRASGGALTVSGAIDVTGHAAGGAGGQAVLLGNQITVASGARIDASGPGQGGTVRVGGDFQGGADPATRLHANALPQASRTVVDSGAVIAADSKDSGKGGSVVIWSTDATSVAGLISARGAGTGAGGVVETSSHGALGVTGTVDVGAPSGQAGTWLLDPTDVTITTGGTDASAGGTFTDNAAVSATSIATALNNGGTVAVQASGAITVASAIAKTAATSASLTLQAASTIAINAPISSSAGTLALTLNAGGAVTQTAALTVSKLELLGSSASYTLTNTGNSIGTLAANTGSINLVSTGGDMTVGTVNTTSGITAGGNVTLYVQAASAGAPASLILAQSLTKSGGANASFTLEADRNIYNTNNAGIGLANGASGQITLTLDAIRDSTKESVGSIRLNGATLNSNGGDIVLGGGATPLTTGAVGGDWNSTRDAGVSLQNTNLSSHGGNITITGLGAVNENLGEEHGVAIFGASTIDSGTGAISITGTARDTATAGNNQFSAGINLFDSNNIAPTLTSAKTSGTAISITGINNGNGTASYWGFNAQGGTTISATGGGNIVINGTSTSTSPNSNGINLWPATISTTTGSITLTGSAVQGSSVGINFTSGQASSVSSSAGGAIGLTADTMNLTGLSNLSTSGTATLQAQTAGRKINLGSTIDTTANNLELSQAELANIKASTLQIGSLTAGAVEVSRSISFASQVTSLSVLSGDAITIDASGGLAVSGAANMVLAAGSTFTNNAGSGALGLGSGRWIIYSAPQPVTGGLTGTTITSATYTSLPPAQITTSGNVFVIAPAASSNSSSSSSIATFSSNTTSSQSISSGPTVTSSSATLSPTIIPVSLATSTLNLNDVTLTTLRGFNQNTAISSFQNKAPTAITEDKNNSAQAQADDSPTITEALTQVAEDKIEDKLADVVTEKVKSGTRKFITKYSAKIQKLSAKSLTVKKFFNAVTQLTKEEEKKPPSVLSKLFRIGNAETKGTAETAKETSKVIKVSEAAPEIAKLGKSAAKVEKISATSEKIGAEAAKIGAKTAKAGAEAAKIGAEAGRKAKGVPVLGTAIGVISIGFDLKDEIQHPSVDNGVQLATDAVSLVPGGAEVVAAFDVTRAVLANKTVQNTVGKIEGKFDSTRLGHFIQSNPIAHSAGLYALTSLGGPAAVMLSAPKDITNALSHPSPKTILKAAEDVIPATKVVEALAKTQAVKTVAKVAEKAAAKVASVFKSIVHFHW